MAGAKRRGKKKSPRQRASAGASHITRDARRRRRSVVSTVATSRTPTLVETAARLGVSVSTVRRAIAAGRLRGARRDGRGRLHVPRSAVLHPSSGAAASPRPSAASPRPSAAPSAARPRRKATANGVGKKKLGKKKLGKKKLGKKKLGKKRLGLGRKKTRAPTPLAKRAPPPARPSPPPPPARPRRPKKVPRKKTARPAKKSPSRKRARRRARKTAPRKKRLVITGILEPTETPSLPPTLPIESAKTLIGDAMRDFVLARPVFERLETGRIFNDYKVSFRKTYGEKRWHRVYQEIIDEYGLEDYIFDYEALRDS